MSTNVIFVASEAAPFAKTGGLADVAGSLPRALKKLGCKVTLFLPYYREVAESGAKADPTPISVTVPLGKREITAEVLKTEHDGVPVYLVKRDEFYDRSYLYGTPEGDYFDNLERYAFFSRAVLETLKARGFDPDIIHCHDWQTALIPALLKDVYKSDLHFSQTATVFTIHNIAYQGIFPPELYDITGLSAPLFNAEGLEFWGNLNLLKAGLVFSEKITTVSEAYSREIQTSEYGFGLEGVLKSRSERLHGVLNGIDYGEWDPEKDPLIPGNYSSGDLTGKAACRKAVLKEFKLKLKPNTPLIAIIARLAAQKGLDILAEAMPKLMELDLGLVILGSGDKMYQELMEGLARKYPEKLSVKIAFNNALSHTVEAGADMFLMPSHFEPCGLNQMYSLRYGTVPIVRATGGLDDTVIDYNGGEGNGFKFLDYTPEALVEKVTEAVNLFKDKKAWDRLRKKGMKGDFSWESSARKYLTIYEQARECLKHAQSSNKNRHPQPGRL